VRPFRLACVATGINIGRGTDPCGRWRVEALAFVTEHFASKSKVKAVGRGGIEEVDCWLLSIGFLWVLEAFTYTFGEWMADAILMVCALCVQRF